MVKETKTLVSIIILGFILTAGIMIHTKNAELKQKKLEAQREYVADQKSACLEIYKEEGEKWNNVNGWRYEEIGDTCFIEYREIPARTQAQCDEDFKNEQGEVIPLFIIDWLNCNSGVFEKQF